MSPHSISENHVVAMPFFAGWVILGEDLQSSGLELFESIVNNWEGGKK
jgi:hypothetical protein